MRLFLDILLNMQKVAQIQAVHQVMIGDLRLMLLQMALLICLGAHLMLTVDTTVIQPRMAM